jgi:RNA polymerase sigma factor (sigma-70 family)
MTVEEVYRKWASELMRHAIALCGPVAAPDVVSDAFAGALSLGKQEWDAVRDPRSYMHRAVHNAALVHHRSSFRRRGRERRWAVGAVAENEALVDPLVARSLALLSLQQRTVTYLTYWLDLPPSAVAQVMNVSEGSVRRQLARSRSRLRKALRDER